MTGARRQRGFTLVELAFAGVIAAGLTLVALELLLQTTDAKLAMEGQIRMNKAARQTMTIIADGGRSTATGTDGLVGVYGARARNGAPATTLADGEVLTLDSNGLTIVGDRNSPVAVTCVGAGDPLPACVGTETLQLDGALVEAPIYKDDGRSVRDRTVEVEIKVRDPWAAARGDGRIERYGGIHIYNGTEGEGVAGGASGQIGG